MNRKYIIGNADQISNYLLENSIQEEDMGYIYYKMYEEFGGQNTEFLIVINENGLASYVTEISGEEGEMDDYTDGDIIDLRVQNGGGCGCSGGMFGGGSCGLMEGGARCKKCGGVRRRRRYRKGKKTMKKSSKRSGGTRHKKTKKTMKKKTMKRRTKKGKKSMKK